MIQNFLTEEQKKFPYAKFFDVPYSDPKYSPELAAKIAKPIDPNKGLPITKIDLLLDPDYDADDEGYGQLADGTGYVAERMFYPGVTQEMFEWWFAWHGLEDSRYKIWDPVAHYGIGLSRRNIEQRCNPNLNWKERNWGTADFVTAWTVNGVATTKINMLSPETFGFDMEKFKKSGASAVCTLSSPPDVCIPSGPSVRVLHQTPEGLKVFLYFWYGVTIVNKKPILLDDYVYDYDAVKLQSTHCAEEYTHLGQILKDVYEQNHNIVDKAENFKSMPF